MSKELQEAQQYLRRLSAAWNGEDEQGDFEGRGVHWEEVIGEAQVKIKELEARDETLVEIARSFSFKLNVGNYESRDFFCSQKAECKWKDAETVSEALYGFCKTEVMKSVNQFRLVDTKKGKDVGKDSAEHDAGAITDEIPS